MGITTADLWFSYLRRDIASLIEFDVARFGGAEFGSRGSINAQSKALTGRTTLAPGTFAMMEGGPHRAINGPAMFAT